MRRLLLLFFLVLSLEASAQYQYIRGIVYQKDNGTVVENANVYYNSTSVGTHTNSKGEFILPFIEGRIPLVISCIGFQSLVISNYSPTEILKVSISVRVNKLREVMIERSTMSRKDMEKMFRREFLGSSSNARKCEIRNLENVSLHYSAKTKALSASCDEPLQIFNPRLGYEIKYYLNDFMHTPMRTLIIGNYVFKDHQFRNTDKNIIRNREKTFEGSRMQLMRAIWARALNTTRFKLYNSKYRRIVADSIICSSRDGVQELCLRERIIISYSPGQSPSKISYLTQKQRSFISSQGFYDTGIQWSGALTQERIGDLLPFDYQPSSTTKGSLVEDVLTVEKAGSTAFSSSLELSSGERQAEEVILARENPTSDKLVVKRWHQPVYYKVYGSFTPVNESAIKESTDEFCSRVSKIIGLDVAKAEHDSLANFIIIAGDLKAFRSKIPSEAYDYLKPITSSGYYYNTSDSGFTWVTGFISKKSLTSYHKARSVVQQLILKGLGFFGHLNVEGSLFYSGRATIPTDINNTDTEIMKALYNDGVRSGMTKAELETSLIERRKSRSASSAIPP